MDRGSYIAANGMIAQQQRLDVLANNLANVNTRGFKGDKLSFGDMMLRTLADRGGDGEPIATLSSGPESKTEVTDFEPGATEVTGNPLDMRIGGRSLAMFAVGHNGGIKYTRDGSFTLNASGDLVTKSGDAVLDSKGQPVRGLTGPVTATASGIAVDGKPVDIGRYVGAFKKDSGGGNLYNASGARAADDRDDAKIESGALETANVNPVLSMVDMIALQRAYEISQKMIQSQDESTAKLADTIG